MNNTINSPSSVPGSIKIALIGYGKMGREIENVALLRGHTVNLKIDIDNLDSFTKENLQGCDVAIEFTGPHSAKQNIERCIDAGIPVVSGSTGWLGSRDEIEKKCTAMNGSFLYASNFSVGVNIFFEVNKKLAQLMSRQEAYNVSIEEIHHTQKKDTPSGTAITLAEQVLQEVHRKKSWVNHDSTDPAELVITSKRLDPSPGTHSIKYRSPIDDIEIIHTAHNRQGFATGAVMAAEFIHDKKGIYSMQDVLGL